LPCGGRCGIGGNSRTALVACLTASSDSLDESLNTLRFAVQCSHVKNKVAKKDKKDVEKAKAADIASSGNELDFDADGAAEVPLPAGTISVRGSWDDASLPAVILLSDSEHTMGWGSEDPAQARRKCLLASAPEAWRLPLLVLRPCARPPPQFDGLVALLKGSARVICPKIGWGKDEKQPEKYVPQLLALCDWLGLAKPVVYGRDCGAMVALAFKIACAPPTHAADTRHRHTPPTHATDTRRRHAPLIHTAVTRHRHRLARARLGDHADRVMQVPGSMRDGAHGEYARSL
jgi:hypothetical protein